MKKSFKKINSHYIVKLKIKILCEPNIPILGIQHREIPAVKPRETLSYAHQNMFSEISAIKKVP